MRTCPICEKGKLQPVDDLLYDFGAQKLWLSGERCTYCGEEIFDTKELDKIQLWRRKYGLERQPVTISRKLGRSGRQVTVRIPIDIERALKLKGNETVAFSVVGKRKVLLDIGK